MHLEGGRGLKFRNELVGSGNSFRIIHITTKVIVVVQFLIKSVIRPLLKPCLRHRSRWRGPKYPISKVVQGRSMHKSRIQRRSHHRVREDGRALIIGVPTVKTLNCCERPLLHVMAPCGAIGVRTADGLALRLTKEDGVNCERLRKGKEANRPSILLTWHG